MEVESTEGNDGDEKRLRKKYKGVISEAWNIETVESNPGKAKNKPVADEYSGPGGAVYLNGV